MRNPRHADDGLVEGTGLSSGLHISGGETKIDLMRAYRIHVWNHDILKAFAMCGEELLEVVALRT